MDLQQCSVLCEYFETHPARVDPEIEQIDRTRS